jgi:3-hydroxyisobutyrate dehydrogenase/2-hydroxy-3-oxopropionate reductase
MGYPMARNLLNAGHEVALWSHTGSKATELANAGKGTACATPAEVGERSDCVFLCVGDSDMSQRTVLGPSGVIEGAKPGTVVVDASTIAPSVSRRMHEELSRRGFHFLDAPCTGSKPGAEGGTLTFMIGGAREVFERVKPWLEPMGKQLYYCGGAGMGLHAKLTQNLILSNILQAFNEGMVLAAKAGVAPELMLDILNNSAAKSGLISFKAPYVFRRDFSTNFSVRWMHKDIGLILDSASDLEVPLPLTAVTQQMFRAAIAKGLADEDICATIKVLEELTGTQVRGTEG